MFINSSCQDRNFILIQYSVSVGKKNSLIINIILNDINYHSNKSTPMIPMILELMSWWAINLMGVSSDGGLGSPRLGGFQILPCLILSYLILSYLIIIIIIKISILIIHKPSLFSFFSFKLSSLWLCMYPVKSNARKIILRVKFWLFVV